MKQKNRERVFERACRRSCAVVFLMREVYSFPIYQAIQDRVSSSLLPIEEVVYEKDPCSRRGARVRC